jgi:hypothetical protein
VSWKNAAGTAHRRSGEYGNKRWDRQNGERDDKRDETAR